MGKLLERVTLALAPTLTLTLTLALALALALTLILALTLTLTLTLTPSPPQTSVDDAVGSLVRLGALTGGGGDAPQRVTSIGKLVAALPASVAVGRLLL